MLESDLLNKLAISRGKAKYDSLVICSGGKDSIASLYYIKVKYKLNPLVFTFDNGFEDSIAIQNVKNATEILGVDWEYFRSGFMSEMYAELIRTKPGFPVCLLCSLWYMQRVYEVAGYHNLKLIIGGWTSGQLNIEEAALEALTKGIPGFIDLMRKKYGKYKDFPRNMAQVNDKFRISKKTVILSPHWFLPYGQQEYTDIIKKELGWRPLAFSYPQNSTNCAINLICSYISLEKLGFTHFHLEKSKLIRQAKLSRQEALNSLDMPELSASLNALIDLTLKKAGCEWGDLELQALRNYGHTL